MNKYIIVFCLFIISDFLFSQGLEEHVLSTNQILVDKWNETKQKSNHESRTVTDTLLLGPKGIFDDFNYDGPFPVDSIWMDENVFINKDYGIAPPSVGVATFDGIDKHGYPYNFLASQFSTGKADTLTSKCIQLSGFLISDSIYFSFYYQPQGRGNAPETNDSLILEFKNPSIDTLEWKHIWAKSGTVVSSDSSWTLVMIAVDTAFRKNGFQFRFTNWATLSGAGDQWNIDYVYLNQNRNWHDTLFDDVAFVYEPPSLLTPYSAMPWRHYDSTVYFNHNFHVFSRNNNTLVKNVNYQHSLSDNLANIIYQSPVPAANVNPYTISGYYDYNVIIPTAIPSPLTGYTDFNFEAILNSTPDFARTNDTITHKQIFSNFYSYDDGTAESAFSLGATLTGEILVEYKSTIADTLQYIDIYFNPLWNDASLYTIYLTVRNDASGLPGTAMYISPSVISPLYDNNQSGPNHCIRYQLANPLFMSAQKFYVGFIQNTSTFLNVGVDKTFDSSNKIWYNTSGTWYNSPYAGSLMIHPVFGARQDFVGVTEKSNNNSFSVYPNPANDMLYIKNKNRYSGAASYEIFDISGRVILENKMNASESIDITELSNGVYFIKLKNGNSFSALKFIKIK